MSGKRDEGVVGLNRVGCVREVGSCVKEEDIHKYI